MVLVQGETKQPDTQKGESKLAIAEALAEAKPNVEPETQKAQLSRAEFMVACLADGTDEATCAARWDASHAVSPEVTPGAESPASTGPPTMGDLLSENAMLRARIQVQRNQLIQAVGIANRALTESKAKDNAQKQMLVTSIQVDSNFTKDELDKKHLSELRTIRLTLDKSMNKTFASVAADIEAASRRRKPHLTAGYYDKKTDSYKGGI